MNNWQPIETAPKDGTEILGWTGSMFLIVEWNEQKWHKKPAPYWDSGRPSITWMREYGQPTHWMPLPDPPAARINAPAGRKETE